MILVFVCISWAETLGSKSSCQQNGFGLACEMNWVRPYNVRPMHTSERGWCAKLSGEPTNESARHSQWPGLCRRRWTVWWHWQHRWWSRRRLLWRVVWRGGRSPSHWHCRLTSPPCWPRPTLHGSWWRAWRPWPDSQWAARRRGFVQSQPSAAASCRWLLRVISTYWSVAGVVLVVMSTAGKPLSCLLQGTFEIAS